jgi:hypothetical protein
MHHRVLSAIVVAGAAALAVAAPAPQSRTAREVETAVFNPGTMNPEAPPETAQFGRFAGVWEATQVRRNPDGTWSDHKTHALWRWYFILDGHAIQDDWIKLDEAEGAVVGTNIRIYNPEDKQWQMAWIDSTHRRLATFTAVSDGGVMVMTGHNAQGRMVRNTFSEITERSFEWTQEWTADAGATWFAVTRIHCERRE